MRRKRISKNENGISCLCRGNKGQEVVRARGRPENLKAEQKGSGRSFERGKMDRPRGPVKEKRKSGGKLGHSHKEVKHLRQETKTLLKKASSCSLMPKKGKSRGGSIKALKEQSHIAAKGNRRTS